ncbi:MAG: Gfo/Idh/MocA family protein [Mariniblastus sp.]
MKPVEFVIIGAGSRGGCYADFALKNPSIAKLIGIAEPRAELRDRYASQHELLPGNVFQDWRELAAQERMADAVVISTLDAMHCEPAIAFANQGYNLMLEKPMATTLDDCRRIVETVDRTGVTMAVGHVLLYTEYTQRLRQIMSDGTIGKIVSVQHLEPVGYWHQAHSFVRGNWRNDSDSSSMLLAKSCHDLDWIRYVVDQPCVAVSSFGNLSHFRREEKPIEAGDATRCVDCDHESQCPYSAKRIYLDRVRDGETGWPVDVVTLDTTESGVNRAIADGEYGRCVYECDNNVVDNQVVSMEFEEGITANLTMTAFTSAGPRRTSIFGTLGEIRGNGSTIEINHFLNDETTIIQVEDSNAFELGQHNLGDDALMTAFFEAVATGDKSHLLSGPRQTLESHSIVFAAEQARREGMVVRLD